MLRETVSTAFV